MSRRKSSRDLGRMPVVVQLPCARINAGGNTRVCGPWPQYPQIGPRAALRPLEPSEPKVWVTCFVPFCPQLNGLESCCPIYTAHLPGSQSLVPGLGLSRRCGARQNSNRTSRAFQTELVLIDSTIRPAGMCRALHQDLCDCIYISLTRTPTLKSRTSRPTSLNHMC